MTELSDFAESIMIAIAMKSDENNVGGGVGFGDYYHWYEALHAAVDDGLESAFQRDEAGEPE